MAPSRVGDSHNKKRLIFRKIRPERTHRRGKLQSLWTRKTERLRYEKINPDPYAKRTACRVAATPAQRSNPVGPAWCTPQAHACLRLEYPHLAIPREDSSPFLPSPLSEPSRARLEPFTRTIVMYHQIHTYTELQQQIHDDLRIQHPEWVESNGESPMCDSYEARLTELLDASTRSNGSIAATHCALEQAVTGR